MKKLNMKFIAIAAIIATSVTLFAQVGADRLVNAYSLINNTWTRFTATTINATTVAAGTVTTSSLIIDTDAVDAVGGIAVGGGPTIYGILSTNISVDFGACGTNATVTLTQAVTGATTNDAVIFTVNQPTANFIYQGAVTSAGVVTLYASNISITNNVNPAASVARLTVLHY